MDGFKKNTKLTGWKKWIHSFEDWKVWIFSLPCIIFLLHFLGTREHFCQIPGFFCVFICQIRPGTQTGKKHLCEWVNNQHVLKHSVKHGDRLSGAIKVWTEKKRRVTSSLSLFHDAFISWRKQHLGQCQPIITIHGEESCSHSWFSPVDVSATGRCTFGALGDMKQRIFHWGGVTLFQRKRIWEAENTFRGTAQAPWAPTENPTTLSATSCITERAGK